MATSNASLRLLLALALLHASSNVLSGAFIITSGPIAVSLSSSSQLQHTCNHLSPDVIACIVSGCGILQLQNCQQQYERQQQWSVGHQHGQHGTSTALFAKKKRGGGGSGAASGKMQVKMLKRVEGTGK